MSLHVWVKQVSAAYKITNRSQRMHNIITNFNLYVFIIISSFLMATFLQ